ncbi:MAG: YraN family protein [Eubacterium sp.]|nr:YraN family protein [Eubacterium sp.]
MVGINKKQSQSTRSIGSEMEEHACSFLEQNGYKVIDRNFHGGRFSELDIVARDGDGYLCFVEVKYRHDDEHGGGEGAIDQHKIRNISKCAAYYMSQKKLSPDTPVRFDVVFIIGDDIRLIQNAFDYAG